MAKTTSDATPATLTYTGEEARQIAGEIWQPGDTRTLTPDYVASVAGGSTTPAQYGKTMAASYGAYGLTYTPAKGS